MCLIGMSHVPICMGLLMVVAVITTYLIAVIKGDVGAIFPYISDTGVDFPERCIFAQFFNMAAFVALCTMLLRYYLIREITKSSHVTINRLSSVCLWIGSMACLGLTLVGNFQENKIAYVHFTGAALVFLGGILYQVLDTVTSFKMAPVYNGRYVCRVRLVLTLCGVVSILFCIVGGALAKQKWRTSSHTDDRRHWQPDDPGYHEHLISTVGEWATAMMFVFYFFTYIRDFQKFTADVKIDLKVQHLDQEVFCLPNVSPPGGNKHDEQPNERTQLLL